MLFNGMTIQPLHYAVFCVNRQGDIIVRYSLSPFKYFFRFRMFNVLEKKIVFKRFIFYLQYI